MKLNFWQWAGILLVVGGAIGYFIATHASPTTHPAM